MIEFPPAVFVKYQYKLHVWFSTTKSGRKLMSPSAFLSVKSERAKYLCSDLQIPV